MSTDYNSRLIADLYAATDSTKATELADEMVSIKDPIFIHPLYAAYRRYPQDEYVSHYFASDLTEFKTPEAAEIIKEIARNPVRADDLASIINYLIEIEFYEEDIVIIAVHLAKQKLNSEFYGYELGMYLKYAQKGGKIGLIEDDLLNAVLDDTKRLAVRKTALAYLLRSNSNEWMKFVSENLSIFTGKSEMILATELIGWQGSLVEKIKTRLRESGSTRTKEILQAEADKNTKSVSHKETAQQQEIAKKYSNADLVAEISSLREKINSTASTDSRFASSLFALTEKLPQQNTAAVDKQSLAGYAIELRTIVQAIDKSITSKEFTEEEFKAAIPDIEKLEGSINKLHVFLHKAGVTVDPDVFGLRVVNKVVSKLAHPEDDAKTLQLLRSFNLATSYEKEEWGKLHRQILEAYRDALAKLLVALTVNKPELRGCGRNRKRRETSLCDLMWLHLKTKLR
jgi:hypothetical protein